MPFIVPISVNNSTTRAIDETAQEDKAMSLNGGNHATCSGVKAPSSKSERFVDDGDDIKESPIPFGEIFFRVGEWIVFRGYNSSSSEPSLSSSDPLSEGETPTAEQTAVTTRGPHIPGPDNAHVTLLPTLCDIVDTLRHNGTLHKVYQHPLSWYDTRLGMVPRSLPMCVTPWRSPRCTLCKDVQRIPLQGIGAGGN